MQRICLCCTITIKYCCDLVNVGLFVYGTFTDSVIECLLYKSFLFYYFPSSNYWALLLRAFRKRLITQSLAACWERLFIAVCCASNKHVTTALRQRDGIKGSAPPPETCRYFVCGAAPLGAALTDNVDQTPAAETSRLWPTITAIISRF